MSKEKLEQLRIKGYDFDVKDVFLRAWQMFLQQPVLSVFYTLLIISLQLMAAIYLGQFAFLFSLFMAPPLYSGFYLVANKISLGLPVIYPDFFKGFTFYFPVFSIWLIGQILVALGIFAFIIPGIYLAVAYNFSVLMAIFGGFDFWAAMEESRKLITVRWWKFFVFSLILLLINLVGILTFFAGLLVTIPITFYATYILFEDLTKDVFSE
jgi:uncharacterized membrane protein